VRPLLIDRAGKAGGLLPNANWVENYPGLEPMTGTALTARIAAHLARFDLSVTRGDVTTLTAAPEGFVIHSDLGEIRTRCLVLAVGTRPHRLKIPGAAEIEGRGLFYEVRGLLARLPKPKRALVIGGGEAALDSALTLAAAGAEVALVARGPRLRARGRLPARVLRDRRIRVELEATPRQVAAAMPGVAIELSRNGSVTTETASAILTAIGRQSAATDLLRGLAGDRQGTLAGGTAGLYVIGDARSGTLGQMGMAVGDGLAVAMEAAALLDEG
jgi:thioredoxin reductase (NADPH)